MSTQPNAHTHLSTSRRDLNVVMKSALSPARHTISLQTHYTAVSSRHPEVRIIWDLPVDLNRDQVSQEVQGVHPLLHHRLYQSNIFRPVDISILATSTSCINDICINGCARLLHWALGQVTPNTTARCAIMSTYDLPCLRQGADDEQLWLSVQETSYWERDTWIIPIHRRFGDGGHWVLCVLYSKTRKMLLFDSLASQTGWLSDVAGVMVLMERMVSIANYRGYPMQVPLHGWSAYPAMIHPAQSNNHDCGIWVLASIAAVLRGFHTTGLTEADMPGFRAILHRLVVTAALPAN